MKNTIKTYSELMSFDSFEDRFEYLKLDGIPTEETFGGSRYLNQRFYSSPEWRKVRNEVIARDWGCDLAVADRAIGKFIVVHHMNPMTLEQLIHFNPVVLNPEYLITVSSNTHRAIHYGSTELLTPSVITARSPNDTCLWRST